MFTQSKDTPPERPGQPNTIANVNRPAGEPSVIDVDLKVMGDLISSGDIHVKGTVQGDIKSRSVTILQGAHVEGSISAETVRVSGCIKGQIEAPSVTIEKSAEVQGDVVHETLSIEAGALLEGNCRRLSKTAQPAKEKVTSFAASGESEAIKKDTPESGSSDKSLVG
jgi:cytoskeletal protein CcmA (bactofilin family)